MNELNCPKKLFFYSFFLQGFNSLLILNTYSQRGDYVTFEIKNEY